MPLRTFIIATFLPLVSLSAKFSYPPNLPGAEAMTYKTIGEVKLDLFVYKPMKWKAEDRRPAAVFFFGGGWKSGSPEQFAEQCKRLAQRGMVAITVDYRVANRHGTKAKDCVADARDAMRWVRSNAARLGVDPNRLAAGGGSAGGHIAACLGTIFVDEEVSSRPNAMLLFNPACMLAPLNGQAPWDRDRNAELRERMGMEPTELSPTHHVSAKSPPGIIFHGKADTTVPHLTAEIFTAKMTEAGVRCELKSYADQSHGFFNFGRNQNKPFEETMTQLDDFLVSLGWLDEKSGSGAQN